MASLTDDCQETRTSRPDRRRRDTAPRLTRSRLADLGRVLQRNRPCSSSVELVGAVRAVETVVPEVACDESHPEPSSEHSPLTPARHVRPRTGAVERWPFGRPGRRCRQGGPPQSRARCLHPDGSVCHRGGVQSADEVPVTRWGDQSHRVDAPQRRRMPLSSILATGTRSPSREKLMARRSFCRPLEPVSSPSGRQLDQADRTRRLYSHGRLLISRRSRTEVEQLSAQILQQVSRDR